MLIILIGTRDFKNLTKIQSLHGLMAMKGIWFNGGEGYIQINQEQIKITNKIKHIQNRFFILLKIYYMKLYVKKFENHH